MTYPATQACRAADCTASGACRVATGSGERAAMVTIQRLFLKRKRTTKDWVLYARLSISIACESKSSPTQYGKRPNFLKFNLETLRSLFSKHWFVHGFIHKELTIRAQDGHLSWKQRFSKAGWGSGWSQAVVKRLPPTSQGRPGWAGRVRNWEGRAGRAEGACLDLASDKSHIQDCQQRVPGDVTSQHRPF